MQNKNNDDETILDPIFNVIPRADTNLIRDCVILLNNSLCVVHYIAERRRAAILQVKKGKTSKKLTVYTLVRTIKRKKTHEIQIRSGRRRRTKKK